VPSIASLGTDHFALGMNSTPCAFPVVTEATEPYCFSTPASAESMGQWKSQVSDARLDRA
jgi:hypothetical protein